MPFTPFEKDVLYDAYCHTMHFTAIREVALERAGHRCQTCGKPYSLHAHHNSYENILKEVPEDMFVMCSACHTSFHTRCGLYAGGLTDWHYDQIHAYLKGLGEDPILPEPARDIMPVCPYCGRTLLHKDGRRFCNDDCRAGLTLRNRRGY